MQKKKENDLDVRRREEIRADGRWGKWRLEKTMTEAGGSH